MCTTLGNVAHIMHSRYYIGSNRYVEPDIRDVFGSGTPYRSYRENERWFPYNERGAN